MKKLPQRMWVNQPSTLQPLHYLHGTNVLAVHDYTWRVYFLKDAVESMQSASPCLSKGWLT